MIILLAAFIFTSLVSVRTWYKPLITLNQISPSDVILKDSASVIDKVATDVAREEAKLSSVLNLSDKEVLSIDDNATQKSLEDLKVYTKVIKSEITGQKDYEVPIINKIDLDIQIRIVKMSDSSFNEFKAQLESNSGLKEDIDPAIASYVAQIATLSTFEKNFFLNEVSRYRKDYALEKKVKNLVDEVPFD